MQHLSAQDLNLIACTKKSIRNLMFSDGKHSEKDQLGLMKFFRKHQFLKELYEPTVGHQRIEQSEFLTICVKQIFYKELQVVPHSVSKDNKFQKEATELWQDDKFGKLLFLLRLLEFTKNSPNRLSQKVSTSFVPVRHMTHNNFALTMGTSAVSKFFFS